MGNHELNGTWADLVIAINISTRVSSTHPVLSLKVIILVVNHHNSATSPNRFSRTVTVPEESAVVLE